MKYDPGNEECPLQYSPFRSCIVPRPIAWISTVGTDGCANLAPYSQCGILTFEPPMVMFAANRYPNGNRKDSAINAEQTGWFVWNMATAELSDAVNTSAMIVPSNVDEFELAKLPSIKADLANIKMVRDSPCHLECKYISTHTVETDTTMGTVDLIYGEVKRIHVNDDYILPDGRIDIDKAQPLGRMGYIDYTVINNTFSMEVPMTDEVREVMNKIMAGSCMGDTDNSNLLDGKL